MESPIERARIKSDSILRSEFDCLICTFESMDGMDRLEDENLYILCGECLKEITMQASISMLMDHLNDELKKINETPRN